MLNATYRTDFEFLGKPHTALVLTGEIPDNYSLFCFTDFVPFSLNPKGSEDGKIKPRGVYFVDDMNQTREILDLLLERGLESILNLE